MLRSCFLCTQEWDMGMLTENTLGSLLSYIQNNLHLIAKCLSCVGIHTARQCECVENFAFLNCSVVLRLTNIYLWFGFQVETPCWIVKEKRFFSIDVICVPLMCRFKCLFFSVYILELRSWLVDLVKTPLPLLEGPSVGMHGVTDKQSECKLTLRYVTLCVILWLYYVVAPPPPKHG